MAGNCISGGCPTDATIPDKTVNLEASLILEICDKTIRSVDDSVHNLAGWLLKCDTLVPYRCYCCITYVVKGCRSDDNWRIAQARTLSCLSQASRSALVFRSCRDRSTCSEGSVLPNSSRMRSSVSASRDTIRTRDPICGTSSVSFLLSSISIKVSYFACMICCIIIQS